jgi:3-dehydroquinate synthetase
VWREFGLALALMLLFFGTWIGHGIAEWQVFTDDQAAHGEAVEAGDFVAAFAASSLENWQSEVPETAS